MPSHSSTIRHGGSQQNGFSDDRQRITRSSTIIHVIVPNRKIGAISPPWQDAIECWNLNEILFRFHDRVRNMLRGAQCKKGDIWVYLNNVPALCNIAILITKSGNSDF